ncbi:hypothetical protein EUX98_g3035 [Antrodiella citrinella]|uniref:Uncharacterized protein n=1 Tax=Antrodiella citrinella TaxID=2447956 RepID=A0A4S4N0E8_9APHY|nr:hypothetical protein EUX98_g3035 [Antrodiella citrinella]
MVWVSQAYVLGNGQREYGVILSKKSRRFAQVRDRICGDGFGIDEDLTTLGAVEVGK